MNKQLSIGLIALAAGACAAMGCSDDDVSPGATITPTPDAGHSPSTGNPDPGVTSETDAGVDGATDPDAAAPFAAIAPQTTTRIANAINPYGLVYANDGLLYASGATIDADVRKLAVWRFKDGALDTTFGTDGAVTLDVVGDESSFDLVEVSDGQFVVHAVAGGAVWLVKLTKGSDGTFAFGTPVKVPFAWSDGDLTGWPGANPPAYSSWGIALDKSTPATPKIVVFAAGAPAKVVSGTQRTDNDRWIARVLADTLAPDPAFNGGAAYSVDIDGAGLGDNARRGIVLADGSIVSAGYTNFGTGLGNHVALIRLTANGAVDPAFGFGTTAPGIPGHTKFNPFVAVGGFAEAYGVARLSSGRYVTTGYGTSHATVPSKSVDLVSFGVKPDGLDTAYGTLGAFAWQSEADTAAGLGATPFTDRGRDLVALADDRTVHVGVYDDHASIFVLDKDGKPDTSTGVDGRIGYSYPAAFFKVTRSPDGKHVAATAQSVSASAGAPLGSLLVTLEVGK